jgi:hypothetical protein
LINPEEVCQLLSRKSFHKEAKLMTDAEKQQTIKFSVRFFCIFNGIRTAEEFNFVETKGFFWNENLTKVQF